MIPGIYPKMVKTMLRSKALPIPTSKNTPRGGKITAKMILKISEQVKAIVGC